ncbi:hypothetical protein Forpe1208_v013430 [Fusarium oxysporum f. sp. rapae]|uniref:Uncharacterized protein n=1 Tax=Fusarium oxysporum f. sp. rapae TaxID=485398 RepID=A0A8J5NVH6_FUSOX|nr:hypothetical protein Forpe1208_v013430 [Fusarium oxysporum f. sp. rapae]
MSGSKQGGDLFDMAKDGTSIPGDAGKQSTISSAPNPYQRDGEAAGGLGSSDLAGAADNAVLSASVGRESGEGPVVGEERRERRMLEEIRALLRIGRIR